MPCTAAKHRRRDRPELELADVFRRCSDQVSLDGRQARVVRAILDCRTTALGGHVHQCDRCNHREIAYNSCRDRHCPKCQGSQQLRWLEAQQRHLLPKDECLSRMIFFGERSLRKATREYAAHYHRERNHQGIDNRLIEADDRAKLPFSAIECAHRLGGMLRFYHRGAA